MFNPMKPLLLLLTLVLRLSAAPDWQKELTSPALGPHPRLAPTAVEYRLSWKGLLDSGTLHIDFGLPGANKPGAYVVRSYASSQGAAARLYRYKHDFWSELDPSTLRPRLFHAVETDPKETVTYTIRHFPDRVESRESTRSLKTGKTTDKDQTFKFAPAFDLFSAMLHIRSQKLAAGDTITLLVHPFDNPYLLRARVVGREVHDGRNAIRLSVGMRKIDRDTLELRPYKKLKSDATLWLSDDDDRIPLEFRAAVFIGDVRATLTLQQKL